MPAQMHAPVSTSDEDKWKHFETRQAAWQIERRHLQARMEHARQHKLKQERARKLEVAGRAKKLANDWKVKEDLAREHAKMQHALSAREQTERDGEVRLQKTAEGLRHENVTQTHLANRAAAEALYGVNDAELHRRGTEHWARGMRTGAEEVAFEHAEFEKGQRAALREFAWAKTDEQSEDAFREKTSKLLPTGPGAISHRQTPGEWRAEQLSMSPAAWVNHPLNGTVERAKTAQMRSHGRQMRELDARRAHITTTLDNWGDLGVRVSEASYEPWRRKVDASFSPRTAQWPDKGTHRIRMPAADLTPIRSPRSSPRRRAY